MFNVTISNVSGESTRLVLRAKNAAQAKWDAVRVWVAQGHNLPRFVWVRRTK